VPVFNLLQNQRSAGFGSLEKSQIQGPYCRLSLHFCVIKRLQKKNGPSIEALLQSAFQIEGLIWIKLPLISRITNFFWRELEGLNIRPLLKEN
jgi:hypothetical protein